ncbi:two-component sensor histidine kinase [Desulfosarcina ovata subsp. sediminis]|uniref:histidine kinase n=1 Tax=Desulfosarcina ovata subsp. sediminis TaxID=885957 RepID=A0A5K7ZL88_9BACT|nr:sensor histidine kinase [Desulfosarcina ovata]BBO80399.1 two-component sensor histidine kinase [Desulfosarcina ovata subsp. sediminis]
MKLTHYKNLRLKLIAITLAVSIGPLILLGTAIYYQFGKLYQERIEDQIRTLARTQSNAVDVFLRERTTILAMIVETQSFETLNNPENLSKLFWQINQRAEGLGLVDLGVIDKEGNQLAYAGPYNLQGLNYYQQPWFDEVLRRGQFISNVFMGFRQVPHVIIAVKGVTGNNSWILRATIDSEILNRLVRSAQVGTSGDAFIVNRDGVFQTSPRFKGVILGQSKIETQRFGEGTTVIETREDSGDIRYIGGAWLKDREWMLVISQIAGQEHGWMGNARNTEIMIIATGCVVILFAIVLISNTLVRHLEQADREMNELNSQLIQQDKLAALGKMAAGIAHEINNPLAVIGEKAGWMEDLLAEEEFQNSENYKEFAASIGKIEEHVDRARKITHNMLGFARRMEPRLDDVEINHVLDQTIEMLSNHARINDIEIVKHYTDRLPIIASDQSQLQQVFLNLINNAIDAIGSDGTIDVSTGMEKEYIRISIHDNGPGIPEAIQKKIFDPFFTTKHNGKGTGLGLSISYTIIEKMGGQISIDSHEDQGTTFVVLLPLVLPEKK